MSEPYVPTTGQVRIAYSIIDGDASTDQRKLAFDRWLAAHDRQVKAEAWDEGYIRGRHPWTGVDQEDDPIPPCTAPPTWGRNANPYRIETEEAP